MKPYLVLRGKFKHSDPKQVVGIDSLIAYDYMGASEYEFGATNRSLKRIVPARVEYSVADTNIRAANGEHLFLFCRNGQWEETCAALNLLVEGKARTKEPSYLNYVIKGEKSYTQDTNFWWDLENDWMAWLGKKFNKLIPIAMEKVAEKWASKEDR